MKKERVNYNYQIISVILLIAVISFAGLYFTKTTECSEVQEVSEEVCSDYIEECEEVPEEKALVLGMLNSWGENMYDSSENIFSVDIYNFGGVEAKNVEVTCEVNIGDEYGYEISDVPVSVVTKNVGNVASTSYKYFEINQDISEEEGNYPLANCYVSSCENCEILSEKIPELN